MNQPKTKGKGPMSECKLYKTGPFPHNNIQIAQHNSGKRHKWLAQLHKNRRVLEKKFIFLNEESGSYVCRMCKEVIEVSVDKME